MNSCLWRISRAFVTSRNAVTAQAMLGWIFCTVVPLSEGRASGGTMNLTSVERPPHLRTILSSMNVSSARVLVWVLFE